MHGAGTGLGRDLEAGVRSTSRSDQSAMDRAMALAEFAYGETSPNPLVGAVVQRGDRVLGEAFHRRAGAPHAEPQALDAALASGNDSSLSKRDWTLYVNLEPCTHHGLTPPCVGAILGAPVGRVVVPFADPDPRVAGRGIELLRSNGVSVDVGCRRAEAAELNHVFIARQLRGRPYVALKVALSADDCVAGSEGSPARISGAESQAHSHRLRAGLDAILVGVETLRRDRPRLDRRLYRGPGRAPRRLVIDPQLRSEPGWLWPGETPPVVFCTREARDLRGSRYAAGAELVALPERSGRLDVQALVECLPQLGLWSVLVEGGGRTHREFLTAGLWDRFYLYRSTVVELSGMKWVASDVWQEVAARSLLLREEGLGTDVLSLYAAPESRLAKV